MAANDHLGFYIDSIFAAYYALSQFQKIPYMFAKSGANTKQNGSHFGFPISAIFNLNGLCSYLSTL
jgi:hypothetical protein